MARYKNGINGPFSGKIGQVVGSSHNGTNYMRSVGNKRTSEASGAELENRQRFSRAHMWLKPLLPLLRVGFHGYSRTSFGFNAAKSYTLMHTMSEGHVVPDRVKISIGELARPTDLNVTLQDQYYLHINWSSAYQAGTDSKDQLMILAYHPEDGTANYIVHGAFRDSGTQILPLQKDLKDKQIHVYAAFIAADRSRQSDSQYFGPITVG